MRYVRAMIVILLSALSSNAIAEAYKCTDAEGKVTYTNTECQAGAEVKSVKDSGNVIDYSKQRKAIDEELAKAGSKVDSLNEVEPELTTSANQTTTTLDKLKQADSLIQTAINTRERLWKLAVVLIAVAAVFLLISRLLRRRRKVKKLSEERELPIPR